MTTEQQQKLLAILDMAEKDISQLGWINSNGTFSPLAYPIENYSFKDILKGVRIKPKFKVGDYVKGKGGIYKIDYLNDIGEFSINNEIWHNQDNYELWPVVVESEKKGIKRLPSTPQEYCSYDFNSFYQVVIKINEIIDYLNREKSK
jgi:hypothetical protein